MVSFTEDGRCLVFFPDNEPPISMSLEEYLKCGEASHDLESLREQLWKWRAGKRAA